MKHFIVFVVTVVIFVEAHETCGVIPISEWGGESSYRKQILQNPVKLVIIQHTESQECNTDDRCQTIAKGIRNYHRFEKGFDDIGPSFLIGGNGKVYEGAGWNRVGAHTKLYNNRSIGISFMGNFQNKLPTTEALQAAHSLISCGVTNMYLSEDYQLVGHQQVFSTLSPGRELQAIVKTWPHWVQTVL
ncbi:peptidoglycan recognition protein-like [Galleria mellonella]|uniref:Peptidoglycan-recognition protein n=1 Tax=Galleria mellonella TaxID=7137 RepID=A0ABM3MX54_GALME|nr:peptidoglycan recognition protein-like [Galleria mellonella]